MHWSGFVCRLLRLFQGIVPFCKSQLSQHWIGAEKRNPYLSFAPVGVEFVLIGPNQLIENPSKTGQFSQRQKTQIA